MDRRAEAAGYSALCLTLDAEVKPKRERNIRNNRDELDAIMDMCGRTTIESIDMDTLVTLSPLLSLFLPYRDF